MLFLFLSTVVIFVRLHTPWDPLGGSCMGSLRKVLSDTPFQWYSHWMCFELWNNGAYWQDVNFLVKNWDGGLVVLFFFCIGFSYQEQESCMEIPWVAMLSVFHTSIYLYESNTSYWSKRGRTSKHTSKNSCAAWMLLLMVQKSHSQPPGMYKTPVNNGINYLHLNWWVYARFQPSTQ